MGHGFETCPSADTAGMNRWLFVLVPLMVAPGLLFYAAYQDALDAETVAGVIVFLVVAVPVGNLGHRLGQRRRGA